MIICRLSNDTRLWSSARRRLPFLCLLCLELLFRCVAHNVDGRGYLSGCREIRVRGQFYLFLYMQLHEQTGAQVGRPREKLSVLVWSKLGSKNLLQAAYVHITGNNVATRRTYCVLWSINYRLISPKQLNIAMCLVTTLSLSKKCCGETSTNKTICP